LRALMDFPCGGKLLDKTRQEETLMIRHFPNDYPAY